MKPGILIAIAIGLYLVMKQGSNPAAMTTAQKRAAINSWWETSTPPNQQIADNGTFEDIINNVTPAEIDTIYNYVFSYVVNNTRPVAGSALATSMAIISNQYNIFQ